jgi:hypothetical protein
MPRHSRSIAGDANGAVAFSGSQVSGGGLTGVFNND